MNNFLDLTEQQQELLKSIFGASFKEVFSELQQLAVKTEGQTNEKLFDNKSAAKYFNVTQQTLYNWRRNGVLSYHKRGGKILYNVDDMKSKSKFNISSRLRRSNIKGGRNV